MSEVTACVPVDTLIRNGAITILDEHIKAMGSLKPRNKTEIIANDRDRPERVPPLNVVNQLIWSTDGRGVHGVWVDGKRVVGLLPVDHARRGAALCPGRGDGARDDRARAGKTVPCEWPVH